MTRPREDVYGEAIWNTSRADESTISVTGARIVARAAMAVADREQAELRREVARLQGLVSDLSRRLAQTKVL